MSRKKQQKTSDEAPGAPEWMVTFSDCMTLLLTFFVLLLSFSTFDDKTLAGLKVIYSTYLPSIGLRTKATEQAVASVELINYPGELEKGSEKPTSEKGKEGGLRLTQPLDFHQYKVFLVPSGDIFLAKGLAISPGGRQTLDTMAEFLKNVHNSVVVSENCPGIQNDDSNLSLSRAYAVIDYLASKQGLDKNRFSISASSTIDENYLGNLQNTNARSPNERILEIVLLDWSIYN